MVEFMVQRSFCHRFFGLDSSANHGRTIRTEKSRTFAELVDGQRQVRLAVSLAIYLGNRPKNH